MLTLIVPPQIPETFLAAVQRALSPHVQVVSERRSGSDRRVSRQRWEHGRRIEQRRVRYAYPLTVRIAGAD